MEAVEDPAEEVMKAGREYVEKVIENLRRDYLTQLEKEVDENSSDYPLVRLYQEGDEEMKKQLIAEDFAAWIDGYMMYADPADLLTTENRDDDED